MFCNCHKKKKIKTMTELVQSDRKMSVKLMVGNLEQYNEIYLMFQKLKCVKK